MGKRSCRRWVIFLGVLGTLAVLGVILFLAGRDTPAEPVLTTRTLASTTRETEPTSEEPSGADPWVGLWRTEGEVAVELLALNEDGSFSLTLHFYGSGGHIYRRFGSYQWEGREASVLALVEIVDDEDDPCDDLRYLYALDGDVMTLLVPDRELVFDRVAERDKPAVLDDPYKAYP